MNGLKIIIILIFFLALAVFAKTTKKEVKYIKSDIDNRTYLVRDLEDKQKAANMLGRIRKNIIILMEHLRSNRDKYPEYRQYIDQLINKIGDINISESSEDSMYTSYSVNKGEQIVFCLRSKKNKNRIHDLNLIMYVALHEISHVACPEFGHTPLFKKIFAFFTLIAMEIGIYDRISFSIDPLEYCGLTISESII